MRAADELRAARQELDAVIEEIQKIPEFRSFLAPPKFDDIARVATQTPLVYLVPADLGGLALVVRGEDVVHLDVPAIAADTVHDRVQAFRRDYQIYVADRDKGCQSWSAALDNTTQWLWDAMEPVLSELKGSSAATLVAGGLLGLLPLHAAWTPDAEQPTERLYALDAFPITYAPNARALAVARKRAEQVARRLVTVTDPSPDPLSFAATEAMAATSGFAGASTAVPAEKATPTEVLEALEQADVALLSCHGFADLDQPLESGLSLRNPGGADRRSDGVLRLRQLLTVDLRLRLAVLSACETSLPGTRLPDEVVSLPTGLLQAGAAGVIASLWRVPDRPTASLMVEFFRLWRWEHVPPLDALRKAQQWVRDTTNGEKTQCYARALKEQEGWLPAEAALNLLAKVAVLPPDKRTDSDLHHWSAFTYVGA